MVTGYGSFGKLSVTFMNNKVFGLILIDFFIFYNYVSFISLVH